MEQQRSLDNGVSATYHHQTVSSQSSTFKMSENVEAISTNSLKNSSSEHVESAINNLTNKLPELRSYFHIHNKIGEGTFSNVYLASLKGPSNEKKFAIKHLIPTCHPKRIKYELECLQRIGGKDNVVSCDLTLREADCVVFIMPYLQHQKFVEYVLDMKVDETRLYMKNLLLALKRVHSFNIIHRDVKPSNFLYNRESKQFLLVDFGLAQRVNEHEESHKLKVPISKTTVMKRKREEDDVENAENPQVKRLALQTLSNDIMNKQDRMSASFRYSKQPLSIQQRKCQLAQANIFNIDKPVSNMGKRQPLSANSTNTFDNPNTTNQKLVFQNLMPQKVSVDSGASFVRVQNSQVQTGSLFPKPTAPVRRKDGCDCDGKPQICNTCLTRKPQYAPRAGTPGFRPPEVLLKYPNQTTAVDMWAAGVVMLCILSGCYPFFRSPDDITALSELISVFGSDAIVKLAKKLGRNVICNEVREPINLWLLCENLRRRKVEGIKGKNPLQCEDCRHSISPEYGCLCESKSKLELSKSFFPNSAFDLLKKLLDINPDTRISAGDALNHPFINSSD